MKDILHAFDRYMISVMISHCLQIFFPEFPLDE
jgi:hypothetical protein